MISLGKKLIVISSLVFSLSIFSSSYEASQAGMSHERLQKIAPTLAEQIKEGRFFLLLANAILGQKF